jgi:hypothetical protein
VQATLHRISEKCDVPSNRTVERIVYFLLSVCTCEDYMMWEILRINVRNKWNIAAYPFFADMAVNDKALSNLKVKCCHDLMITDSCGRAAYGVDLRPFNCWSRTESRWGRGCSSVVWCVGRDLLDGRINGKKKFETHRCLLIWHFLYYAFNNIENALDFLQDYS